MRTILAPQLQSVRHFRSVRHFPKQEKCQALLAGHVRALLVSEGSGGHLIPALEVGRRLCESGAAVDVLYIERAQVAGLLQEMLRGVQACGGRVFPVAVPPAPRGMPGLLWRGWHARRIWRMTRNMFLEHAPNVVVGFGGWVCVPVVAAARAGRVPVVLHEQNVRLGRANRWLRPWADELAISFDQASRELDGTAAVLTGLPIRRSIGTAGRSEAAAALGLDANATTLLVLGGSQGSQALNRVMMEVVGRLTDVDRRSWQVIHLTGPAGSRAVQVAYAQAGLRCWVSPHLDRMEWAYALADLAVARGGASTMAELARCGVPAVLIPYPGASGHQRDNAKLLESHGAAVRLEEHDATPGRLLEQLRTLLSDPFQREQMSARMAELARPDAADELAVMIARVARSEMHGAD